MRLVFAGTPDVAVHSLRALLDSRHDVVAVVTRPDAPAGRGRQLVASPVAAAALAAGVEVLRPSRVADPGFLERLRELAPDCCPVVAYGALVPPVALAIPLQGWVNLHFSLLPAWRGAAPVQHAIMAGDDVTGASTFLLEQGLDTGPVFGTVTETIAPTDTTGHLLDRLATSGARLLAATLDALDDGVAVAHPQPTDGVSLAPKITSAEAEVSWAVPALAVGRRIRGCTPSPGAWTALHGARLGLGPVRLLPDDSTLAPGEVRVSRTEVAVGTASHAVALGEVRAPGKRAMPAPDWARGARIETGTRLGADRAGGTA